jgi:hypothetical protein
VGVVDLDLLRLVQGRGEDTDFGSGLGLSWGLDDGRRGTTPGRTTPGGGGIAR